MAKANAALTSGSTKGGMLHHLFRVCILIYRTKYCFPFGSAATTCQQRVWLTGCRSVLQLLPPEFTGKVNFYIKTWSNLCGGCFCCQGWILHLLKTVKLWKIGFYFLHHLQIYAIIHYNLIFAAAFLECLIWENDGCWVVLAACCRSEYCVSGPQLWRKVLACHGRWMAALLPSN